MLKDIRDAEGQSGASHEMSKIEISSCNVKSEHLYTQFAQFELVVRWSGLALNALLRNPPDLVRILVTSAWPVIKHTWKAQKIENVRRLRTCIHPGFRRRLR
ncbi:hypothetical protein PV327_001561 [Microctonus hyperodae]|uniref:Uncharacterized protein n=1 Tax=Microctonus hyperodae TaxID=165561 RepID=A0AA39G8H6_MICHY|nr:hypothetical protein PV327_001561 [Microctonus hyperodae]